MQPGLNEPQAKASHRLYILGFELQDWAKTKNEKPFHGSNPNKLKPRQQLNFNEVCDSYDLETNISQYKYKCHQSFTLRNLHNDFITLVMQELVLLYSFGSFVAILFLYFGDLCICS